MERYLRVKFVGTGPSSYEKRVYRAAVSQRSRSTGLGAIGMDILEGTLASLLNPSNF